MKVNKKGEGNLTAKYPKYIKLLEGLTDDKEYYNMIPIIIHGSEGKDYVEDELEKEMEEKTKKRAKGTIPKLEKEDRLDLLPLIIKGSRSNLSSFSSLGIVPLALFLVFSSISFSNSSST